VAALLAGALLAPASAVRGQEVITQDEALRLAFPDPAEVERRTAFLDEEQMRRATELAGSGVEIEEPLVTYYVGSRGDSVLGVSYFDAHTVRTLPEVLMVTVTPAGAVSRVEVLKFDEPPKYRPPDGWLGEFRGMDLSRDLSPGRGVVTITGATLTTRAVTRAVRRVLALHEIIAPVASGGEAGP
jgi:Na+-translocating ferredoxin:NAD+ oxidoreductase RnfG subunit